MLQHDLVPGFLEPLNGLFIHPIGHAIRAMAHVFPKVLEHWVCRRNEPLFSTTPAVWRGGEGPWQPNCGCCGAQVSGPPLLALPMRLAWQFWVGVGHEVSEYRTVVRQIVDSGHQVASFSQTLTTSLGIRIPPAKQRLIEAEFASTGPVALFAPTRPADLPLSAIMALPLILIGFPFMLFMEYLLIRAALILALKTIERLLHWQVIHIPKPHRGNKEHPPLIDGVFTAH